MTLPYRCLLLGLDGTPWAETLLGVVERWANPGSTAVLLHVLEEDGPERVHGAAHLRRPEDARRYLEDCAGRLRLRGLDARWILRRGVRRELPETIAETAEREGCDLVLLATHGRVDPRRWARGSIAQQVLARARRDVLQLTPRSPEPGAGPRSLLVPLDGDPDHEAAFRRAVDLAQRSGAALCLAQVLPAPGNAEGLEALRARLVPRTDRLLRRRRERAAAEYLAGWARRAERAGVRTVTHLGHGEPVTELTALARRCVADLVVLASHGRHAPALLGKERLPGRLVEKMAIPLLTVPAGHDDRDPRPARHSSHRH